MSNIAVFPGSFDPFTTGHKEIIDRAYDMFDHIIVAIGYNSEKKNYFPLNKREEWIRAVFAGKDKVSVASYQGLTVDFCKEQGAQFILRGLRNSTDFEYEKNIAQMNQAICPGLETVFLLSSPGLSAINSNIVRDIIRHGGDASQFLPAEIVL